MRNILLRIRAFYLLHFVAIFSVWRKRLQIITNKEKKRKKYPLENEVEYGLTNRFSRWFLLPMWAFIFSVDYNALKFAIVTTWMERTERLTETFPERNTIVCNMFDQPIITRFLRIYPLKYKVGIGLRVELSWVVRMSSRSVEFVDIHCVGLLWVV